MPIATALLPAMPAVILAAKRSSDDGDAIVGVIFMIFMIVIAVVSSIAQSKKQGKQAPPPWANRPRPSPPDNGGADGWEAIDGDEPLPPMPNNMPLAPPSPAVPQGWEPAAPPTQPAPPLLRPKRPIVGAGRPVPPAPPAPMAKRYDVPANEAVDYDPWAVDASPYSESPLAQSAQIEVGDLKGKKRRKKREVEEQAEKLTHLADTKLSGDFKKPSFSTEFGEEAAKKSESGETAKRKKSLALGSLAGLSRNDLARAIVLAEIFGPPLSERERGVENPETDERSQPYNIHRMI